MHAAHGLLCNAELGSTTQAGEIMWEMSSKDPFP
jgi:hypothetical protein